MKFHIVKSGEKVKDILFIYNLNIDELKENNRHIRFWDKLIPGTKIKIPVITEAIDNDVEMMEPFIEDYYPKQSYQDVSEENEEVENIEVKKDDDNIHKNEEDQGEFVHSDHKENKEELKKEYKNESNSMYQNMQVVNVLCFHPYYGYVVVPYYMKKPV